MGAPTWTKEEDCILTQCRKRGDKFHEIARRIQRTPKACMARFAALTGDPGIYMANAANDNIRRATDRLGRACNMLLKRMPPNEVALVLGGPGIKAPGTERHMKTCQVERIAA
jgi:hypothetical protein